MNGRNGGFRGQATIKEHSSDCRHTWRTDNWADRQAIEQGESGLEESDPSEGDPEEAHRVSPL